jgi:CubicO group peptidase (beta-lactamase class C family)
MKGILLLALSMSIFWCCDLATAQSSSAKTPNEVERRIERVINGLLPETALDNQYGPKASLTNRMAYYHTPGVSIAVVNNFKIEWARGFGVKEWGKRSPVTETTLFEAGSVSKPVFAMAVMRLSQDGKIDLDKDVNDYLRTWKVPANGSWQPHITLRQLLSHSAGMTVHGFPGYLRSERLPSVLEILDGSPPANTARIEVNIVPGTQVRYSGGGITVAQQLVVDVLGEPFPKIMRELVLDPSGMKHSTYEQPLPKSWEGSAATAHPYKNHPLDGKWHVYPEMAAAGLWTTPSDLARAGIELQLAFKGDSNCVLSTQTATAMLTPGIEEEIGIGFFLSGTGRNLRFGHSGWDEGFVAEMTMYKETGKGAVIMLNSNEGNPILYEIERAIAREYDWMGYFTEEKKSVSLSGDSLRACVGTYASKSGLQYSVVEEKGHLLFQPAGQPPIEIHPESGTNFFMKILNTEVTFERTKNGRMQGLTLRQDGRTTTAERKP